jgi:hypothetical protein
LKVGDIKAVSIKWTRTKPGCSGTCPTVEADTVAFTGEPKLTALVDRVLAFMTGVDKDHRGPYQSIDEYTQFFWQTAQARDSTAFKASVRDVTPAVIAIELHTTQNVTGAAHAIPATQFLNWQRREQRVLALDEALAPGKRADFDALLRAAHARWMADFSEAKRDPATFKRMWPFQESDNFALTQDGLVVKYDAYSIAPYSAGQPELVLPYDTLKGILLPQWMPAKS